MPHQSRGFWCCDYCKLTLDSVEDAKQHEDEECQKNPNKPQQQEQQQQEQPPNQQQLPLHHQAQQFQPAYYQYPRVPPHFSGYYSAGAMAPVTEAAAGAVKQEGGSYENRKSFPLMGLNESSHMNADDSVACQSLEVFEASHREVADEELRSQFAGLAIGQLGLRCIHCSSNPQSLSEATYFPASAAGVESLADGVRMLSERHLRKCNMAPASVRDINQQATEKRRSHQERDSSWQDDERSRSALRNWCFRFCQRLGIVDKGPNNRGLVFIQYSGDTMVSQPAMPGPGIPGRPRPGMAGQAVGAEPFSATPMARRRDRPPGPPDGGEYRPMGAYDPYAQSSEGYYVTQEMPTAGHDRQQAAQNPQQGGSPHRSYQQQQQMASYEMAGNFPFYQEATGTWSCRYCSHVPPPYRDPQSSWAAPNHMPPPPPYVEQHLNMCRAYHQSLQSQSMYQGAPPQFGYASQQYPSGYGVPQQPTWEATGPGAQSNQGQPMPYAYPPGSQEANTSNQRQLTSSSPGASYPPTPHHQVVGASEFADLSGRSVMSQPRAAITSSSSLGPTTDSAARRAIEYLVNSDREANFAAGVAVGDDTDQLVLEEDQLLLTDYFYHLMKQLRLCRFSESDRKTRGGKREKILIGFGGLQCIHCSDANNSRKFFWSNVDRLANSFAEIPGHILKCRHCPQQTKDALYQLKQLHPEQMARLPRGSQKVFFRRMWRRLHDEDPEGAAASPQGTPLKPTADTVPGAAESSDTKFAAAAKASSNDTSPSGTTGSDESILLMQRSTKQAAKALADSLSMNFPPSPSSRVLLAIPEDKEWLSDTDCFIRRQIEVFCSNTEDVQVARNDRKFPIHEGQVGIRCIHCALAKHGSGARGSGVAYPFSVSGIYESVREFQRLHLDSCENLPEEMKAKLADLKGSTSLSSVLRKYYVLAAKALGLRDTRDGIRAGADSVPIGSQAAFAFSDSASNISEEMRRSAFGVEAASPSMTPVDNRKRKPQNENESETPGSSESSKKHRS